MATMVLGDAGILAPGRWRRLRALAWMAALFVTLTFVLYPGWARRLLALPEAWRDGFALGATLLAYLGYAGLVRWAERRPPGEVALPPLARELAVGLAIGTGMFAAVFGVLRLTGTYTLAPGDWTDWGSDIVRNLTTGLREELLVRLVLFRLAMRAFGLWPALAISALLFGAGHLANPNAGVVPALAIAVEAGLMLAAFYLLTGRIWMAVGVHAAWNFAQGAIFGARVSGFGEPGSLFVSAPAADAPAWLSGGAFGPEASVVAMTVGFAVFAVVLRRVLRDRDG